MNKTQFDTAQKTFAQRLRRLLELPNRAKGRTIDVDAVAGTAVRR